MTRRDLTLVVRLPADLKERLRQNAETDRRTLTGQVIRILEAALPPKNEKAETAPTVPAR